MTPSPEGNIRVIGLSDPLARKVAAVAETALAAVGGVLASTGLTVCVDDQGVISSPWLGCGDPDATGDQCLILYCSSEAFFTANPRGLPVGMAREIWEQHPAPRDYVPPSPQDFSSASSASFLHHHFLFAEDILTRTIDPAIVPPKLLEGFQEAWAVTVDGRLDSRGLPCFARSERRGRFSKTFAAAGVLLPSHWGIFGSLWEGGLRTQDEVLGAVRLLPGL